MNTGTLRPPPEAGGAHPGGTGWRAALSDYWLLIRPRIIGMVLFTMSVAAVVAAPQAPSWAVLAHSLAGASVVIAGAIALNQRIERRTDALMLRTARRPLPAGRLSARRVTWFGVLASGAGLGYLVLAAWLWAVPAWVAALTLASWIVYVWIYTPMKLFSAWQTPLGALAGAMPTLMGAAAAGAPWSAVSLALFGVVYFWQFPHAMAIAWLYREDFAAAGLKVAAVTDPSGRTAGILSVVGAVVLVPIGMLPWAAGAAGGIYACVALVLGAGYLAYSVSFFRACSDLTARTLLRVSLVYLPALFAALLAAVVGGR